MLSRVRNCAAIVGATLFVMVGEAGCSKDSGPSGTDPQAVGTSCQSPQTGCPCDAPGALVACGTTACADGYRKCIQNGTVTVWGPCHSVSTGQICETDAGTSDTGGCTLTQGFWKTHPAAWPVQALTLGGRTYSEAELLQILQTPPGGDASLILAHQLIATLLNAASGAGQGPVSSAVADAQAWMSANSGGKALPYGVSSSSAAGAQAIAIAGRLDSYNNGAAGVAHCNN
jgi:hypothetical protein